MLNFLLGEINDAA